MRSDGGRLLILSLQAARKWSGGTRTRLYDLRHTYYATLLLSHNVHPKYVQELLGHASSIFSHPEVFSSLEHLLLILSKRALAPTTAPVDYSECS